MVSRYARNDMLQFAILIRLRTEISSAARNRYSQLGFLSTNPRRSQDFWHSVRDRMKKYFTNADYLESVSKMSDDVELYRLHRQGLISDTADLLSNLCTFGSVGIGEGSLSAGETFAFDSMCRRTNDSTIQL